MLINLGRVALWSCLPCLLISCGAREDRYLVTGSSTVAPILQKAAERLGELDAGLKIDVQTGGSTRGILDTHNGANDAGMASRDLTPEESLGIETWPVAYDGVAVIVHADNPVERLTREEVRSVFTRASKSWSELGGETVDTMVVNKAEGRATLDVFLQYTGLENREIEPHVVIGDNAQGIRLVSGNTAAIGYVSIGEALHSVERGVPIKLVEIDGVAPTLENVASGTFPLRRTLYLLFAGELDESDRTLTGFLASAAGREVIEELKFVPVFSRPEVGTAREADDPHGSPQRRD